MSLKRNVVHTAIATSLIFFIPTCLALSGYFMVNKKYQLPETVFEYIQTSKVSTPAEIKPEEVSLKLNIKTVYYIFDDENKQIEHILLELLNCKTKKIQYITIPTSTKLTLSNTLFQTMKETYVSVPQIMKLSMLYQYFENQDAFTNGIDIMQEAFGIHIDYYTIMDKQDYKEVFETSKEGIEVIKDEYLAYLDQTVTLKNMKELMSKFYSIQKTNYDIEQRLSYLETYESLKPSDITFQMLQGEQKNEAFVPDFENIKRLILEFCNIS